MINVLRRGGAIALLFGGLTACAEQQAVGEEDPFEPEYKGVATRLLDDDLVAFDLTMSGARDGADVQRYGDCAAAQYALIRGYGYARHLRTNTSQSGEIWQGDAVYTISAEKPAGLNIIVAEDTVAECRDEAIPTV
ncbi:MAG: hypothetical protein AAF678_10925 [Pseudomonadota bacterium]